MTTRTIKSVYDRALAPAGLNQTSYTLLSRLAVEGPFTINDLARRLAMDRSTCSRELESILRARLAERTVGVDRRERLITLTATGRRRVKTAERHWHDAQDKIRAEFGTARTSSLLGELHALLRTSESLQEVDTKRT